MFQVKCVSSLVKVFPDMEPQGDLEGIKLSALHGETVSFQCAYSGDVYGMEYLDMEVVSEWKEKIQIREVKLMPSVYAAGKERDDNYLRTTPGMYPDLLRTVTDGEVQLIPEQWMSVWISFFVDDDMKTGDHPITVILRSKDGNELGSSSITIRILSARLPQQTVQHTQWFHADCLADYYNVSPWSEEHWKVLENFFYIYGKRGINMILTPTVTPALDTEVGRERTTVQLIDISLTGNTYHFEFSKLKRWIDLCRKHGIIYFEIAHLFSQWGARNTPKVMVTVDGEYKKLFGWETLADSEEYALFLKEYLLALTEKLREWDLVGKVYFHLSDEPEIGDIERYRTARELVKEYIGEFPILDALSNYEFYERGIVDRPVPGNNHMEAFLDHNVQGLWTYYCCAQGVDVSNCFFSMPSSRNRILGVQMYKFQIEGFLHWGFNFYNTRLSRQQINPYEVTDAGGAFQSGDAFLVYPGKDGKPEESIRLMVLEEAMQDVRAFQLLESLTSRDFVMSLIEQGIEPITFKKYPKENDYLLRLREKVNAEIEKYRK